MIDRNKAWVFVVDLCAELTPEQTEVVCTRLLPHAGRLTTGELSAQLLPLVEGLPEIVPGDTVASFAAEWARHGARPHLSEFLEINRVAPGGGDPIGGIEMPDRLVVPAPSGLRIAAGKVEVPSASRGRH